MKTLAIAIILAAAVQAQQIAVWNETTKTYVAVRAGTGIKVDLTAKTISATATVVKPRVYGTVLPFASTSNGWAVPFGAIPSSMVIWVNGLRYVIGTDYTVVAGLIAAINPSMMSADAMVVVDYDQQ